MKTKLLLLATNLFTLNINCEIPTYTSLKDVIQRCQELPGQTYAQSCDACYAKFKDQINVRDEDGMLPITFNAYHNEERTEQIVSALIRHGADLEATDKYDRTALTAAISNANPTIVNNLIQSGANLERINKNGETPLFGAARTIRINTAFCRDLELSQKKELALSYKSKIEPGYVILNKLLDAGVNLEHKDNYGYTVLHSVAISSLIFPHHPNFNEKKNLFRALVKMGADVNTINNDGSTPLHSITLINKPDIVMLQEVIRARADVNARNKKNHFYSTPLDAIWYPVVIKGASEEQKIAAGILMKHSAKITDVNFKCLVLGGNNCKLIDPWDSILK